MELKIKIPAKSINKAFQKDKVNRTDFENFKIQLQIIVNKIDDKESEEHLKNFLIQFFKNTFYQNNEVNTKGRTDLAIYNGNDNKSTVGVIFETKKPANKADMITKTDINKKALHEIILYYLQERIEFENNEIKNIVVTNLNEWFIFDAIDFERAFFNTELKKEYKKWKTGLKTSKNTDLFYNEIAKKYIKQNQTEIECTFVNLQIFKNIDKLPENKLINLYKLFSPEYLLKLPHVNDSNSLDTGFYDELLHIIGLEETKINNKKVIKRKEEANRNTASLIENTINILQTEDRLKHINDIEKRYGTKQNEQIINIALELNIMWVNRILFLKLLEAQLVQYNGDNLDYHFLKPENIVDFDELNELFFEVLAKEHTKRNQSIKEKYKDIPYLNSSLFEISQLEDETIRINSLKSRLKLPKSNKSILSKGKEFTILEYIFNFLNAYDFTSEGSGKIQEENKNLINASVLGLIFEKINGYKDGSYFTPGYITMYMSRENIRNAVVQKFIDTKLENFKNITNFNEIKDKIENRKQANNVINSLKICDPAVGSGHFLVSALNEIIAIKSELGILEYQNGNRIKNYKIEIVNDELIISDKETEELFEYSLNKKSNIIDYKQDLQEAIFREKQTIIENCLFGVDINPNSVNICRLRLWIELLKNSFYTKESNYTELETLPNIDINIKQGNSLVGRFALNGNGVTNGQAQKMKLVTEKYKTQVVLYKSTNDKIVKQKAEDEILKIKQQFAKNVNPTDKDYILLQQKKAKLGEMPMLFSETDKEEWKKETEKISNEVIELEKKYELKLQTLYGNAFEWRFEFPEVLDENGNFIGFDIIIGNPPYGVKLLKQEKEYFLRLYNYQDYQLDTYILFMEKALELLSDNAFSSLIVPNSWLLNLKTPKIRQLLFQKTNLLSISQFEGFVFEKAIVNTLIVNYQKINNEEFDINNSKINIEIFKKDGSKISKTVEQKSWSENYIKPHNIYTSKFANEIKIKFANLTTLNKIANIKQGVKPFQVGKGKPAQTRETVDKKPFVKTKKSDNSFRPLLRGSLMNKYVILWNKDYYISYGDWLAEPRYSGNFEVPEKIVIRQTGSYLIATIDTEQFIVRDNLYTLIVENKNVDLKYLLALLNSKLLSWYYQNIINYEVGEALAQVKKGHLELLPIKITSKTTQIKIISKVDKILNQKKEKSSADTSKLENEIDTIIYKLYKLSEKEIKQIEQNYMMR